MSIYRLGTPPRISTLTSRQSIGRKFYNLVLKSQGNEETRKVVEALYNTSSDEVGKLIERVHNEIEAAIEMTEATTTQHTLQVTTQVRDLERTVTKGRKKRLKGYFETSQKKGSKNSTQKDSATKTRNKHVI